MGILDSVLKAFVGDKSKKDIGEIQPVVDSIKALEGEMAQLSLDELRARSDDFRKRIQEAQQEVQDSISKLEEEAEQMQDIDKKENIKMTR